MLIEHTMWLNSWSKVKSYSMYMILNEALQSGYVPVVTSATDTNDNRDYVPKVCYKW